MWNSWDAHLFAQSSSWITLARAGLSPVQVTPPISVSPDVTPHAPGAPPPVPLRMLVPQQPAFSSQAVHASKPGQGQLVSPWGHTCHPPPKHATFSALSPCLGFPSPAPPCESLHSSAYLPRKVELGVLGLGQILRRTPPPLFLTRHCSQRFLEPSLCQACHTAARQPLIPQPSIWGP